MSDAEVKFDELRPGDLIITPGTTRFILATVPTPNSRSFVNITMVYRTTSSAKFPAAHPDGIHTFKYLKTLELGQIFSYGLFLLRAHQW